MTDLVPAKDAEETPLAAARPGYTVTLHLKVKPEAYTWLSHAAREVNQVWNFANATRAKAARPFAGPANYLSAFDLNHLVTGIGACFEKIGSDTAQEVNKELVTRGKQFKRTKLRFRSSAGSKRALGWVPFKAANLRVKGDRLRFQGKTIRLFQMARYLEHWAMPGVKLGAGNFAQNALGEWFLNVPVWVPHPEGTTVDEHGQVVFPAATMNAIAPRERVGLDPGLKAVLTTSDGDRFEPNRSYRDREAKIAIKQKRGHKKQAKRLHAQAKHQRQDATHKISHWLISNYQQIAIGDVSLNFLRAGNHAKSALDSGLGMLKAQLHAKGHRAGRWVYDVSEAYSTQTCSSCRARTGPTGWTGLVVRHWRCSACGDTHDRDVNAAKNIRDAASRCERIPIISVRKQKGSGRPFAGTR